MRSRSGAALFAAALVAGTSQYGCNAIIGVEGLSTDSGRGAEDVEYAEADCAECVGERCVDEASSCSGDCLEAFECLAGCDRFDWRCRADCEAMHAGAMATDSARRLDRCIRLECMDGCYGIGGIVSGIGSQACSDCFDVECRQATQWCMFSDGQRPGDTAGDCEREWWCIRDAERMDPAMRLSCTNGYPHPVDARNTFHICREAQCQQECPFGTNWTCVGDYTWPGPTTGSISYDLYVREGSTSRVGLHTVRGVTIKACAASDCESCSRALDQGFSDDNEEPVTLELPMGVRGFEGCFHVMQQEAAVALEPIQHSPEIHYFGRPITKHEGRVTIGLWPTFEGIEAIARVDLDPTRGTVLAVIHDCMGDRAHGVTYELSGADERTRSFYMQGSPVPVSDGPTDSEGRGGFFDVPVGRHVVSAWVDDEVVSSMEVEVREGWITQVWLYPTPAE